MPFACLIDSITLCACAISRNGTKSNCFLANDLGFNIHTNTHTCHTHTHILISDTALKCKTLKSHSVYGFFYDFSVTICVFQTSQSTTYRKKLSPHTLLAQGIIKDRDEFCTGLHFIFAIITLVTLSTSCQFLQT